MMRSLFLNGSNLLASRTNGRGCGVSLTAFSSRSLSSLKESFSVVSAPLEDWTDLAFRGFMFKLGATKTFTEMARLEGLSRDDKMNWRRVLTDKEVPTVVQILPSSLDELNKTLDLWEEKKVTIPMEWNLNVGCPSKKVTKYGLGCAMIKEVDKINKFIETLRKRTPGVPASIKLRLGANLKEKEEKLYLKLIEESDADYYIVHARHGDERDHKPDHSAYDECLRTGKVIIANGAVSQLSHIQALKQQGLNGVMVGWSSVTRPLVFNEFSHYLTSSNDPILTMEDVRRIYCEIFDRYNGNLESEDPEAFDKVSRYKKRLLKQWDVIYPKATDSEDRSSDKVI